MLLYPTLQRDGSLTLLLFLKQAEDPLKLFPVIYLHTGFNRGGRKQERQFFKPLHPRQTESVLLRALPDLSPQPYFLFPTDDPSLPEDGSVSTTSVVLIKCVTFMDEKSKLIL